MIAVQSYVAPTPLWVQRRQQKKVSASVEYQLSLGQTLLVIYRYFVDHGKAPTYREIGEARGFSSTAAWYHVRDLVKLGYMRYCHQSGHHRRIALNIDTRLEVMQ